MLTNHQTVLIPAKLSGQRDAVCEAPDQLAYSLLRKRIECFYVSPTPRTGNDVTADDLTSLGTSTAIQISRQPAEVHVIVQFAALYTRLEGEDRSTTQPVNSYQLGVFVIGRGET